MISADTAITLADLAYKTLSSILEAIAKAKGGPVDVSSIDIPASYYDDMRRLGATDAEIADLKA